MGWPDFVYQKPPGESSQMQDNALQSEAGRDALAAPGIDLMIFFAVCLSLSVPGKGVCGVAPAAAGLHGPCALRAKLRSSPSIQQRHLPICDAPCDGTSCLGLSSCERASTGPNQLDLEGTAGRPEPTAVSKQPVHRAD
ncbi:hypothetical protein P4O66_016025 [Electrophorus voltai]|uniref:Uncharacterized protein n=1 Tax=Electrophorus voltai TaxID=2609070 RepID=A0AAD8YX37_9TELE|nr:hypothetical protein P4O66_016025 [Electrophorus voltai]